MSPEIRSLSQDATLQEAAQLMQKWKMGSLLLTDKQSYVGFITDSMSAREVVANGLNPAATAQNLHAKAGGGNRRRPSDYRGGAYDERAGHPAPGRDARRPDHRRDFGIQIFCAITPALSEP